MGTKLMMLGVMMILNTSIYDAADKANMYTYFAGVMGIVLLCVGWLLIL